jgi:hypothetical protein
LNSQILQRLDKLKRKYKKLKHDIYEYDDEPEVSAKPKKVELEHEDLVPELTEAPEPEEPLPPRMVPRGFRKADVLDYTRCGF